MRRLTSALFCPLILFVAGRSDAAIITVNIVNSSVNDLGTTKAITGSMMMDLGTGLASGTVSVNPQAICFPWAAGKAIIWVLKTAEPAGGGLSLLDVSGGDLGGTLNMVDAGTGTNITDVFRLTRTGATTADLTSQITATYDPTIALLGQWTSSEAITGMGPGHASAAGTSAFFRASNGTPIVAPYSVSYNFLGNPSSQLTSPIALRESVNANLATGQFTAQVSVVPEPSTVGLIGFAIIAVCLLGGRGRKTT